jgi:O-antigen/teichoic acid export membrane protein
MWPMMIGLAIVAEPLIKILLTDKWIPAVPYLRIYCIIFAFQPIQTANLNAIRAMGRSDLFLRLEIIKKIIGICILCISMNYGVMALALSLIVYSFIAQILNASPNKKLLGYSYLEQIKDIFPSILLSCIMAIIVWALSIIFPQNMLFITLLIQVIVGIAVYICGSKLFKFETFEYILSIVKKI